MSDAPRTLLISGGSRGIGAALVKLRHARGDRLILLSRQPPGPPSGLPPELTLNDRVQHYPVDLRQREALTRTVKQILKDHPALDGVISNAGDGCGIARLEQLSPAQIEASIQMNLVTHLWLARLVWPHLRSLSQSHADLLFTGSEAALAGAEHGAIYCAAKFGLRGFAQSLRAAAIGTPIRVGIVQPGPVATGFFDELGFAPHPSEGSCMSAKSAAQTLSWMLDAPVDAVVEELVVSPRKRRFERKKRPQPHRPG